MNAIECALLAIEAANAGDAAAAREHISRAQQQVRTTARRDRQIIEVAACSVAGRLDRAAGLALEHAASFPDDADLVERLSLAERMPPG